MALPYAWVAFYMCTDGSRGSAEAIGSNKEQAKSRLKRLLPGWDDETIKRIVKFKRVKLVDVPNAEGK